MSELALLQIGEQMLQAREQILPAGLDRLLDHLRIGEGIVAGRGRLDEAPRHEAQALLVHRIEPVDRIGHAHEAIRGEQVDLADEIENRVLAPARIGEAAIPVGRRRRDLLLAQAARLRQEALPDRQPLARHVGLDLGDALDIVGEIGRRLHMGGAGRLFEHLGAALEDQLLRQAHDPRPVLQLAEGGLLQKILCCFGHAHP